MPQPAPEPVCAHVVMDDGHARCRVGRHPEIERHCGTGCAAYLPDADRQPCEIWCRVMGYYRPTSFYNKGKQQEHRDRRPFKEPR